METCGVLSQSLCLSSISISGSNEIVDMNLDQFGILFGGFE